MGLTLSHRVGADPRFGHANDREIQVFEPHGGKDWKVVNVDTTLRSGIVKAGRMGLVESGLVDLVSVFVFGFCFCLFLWICMFLFVVTDASCVELASKDWNVLHKKHNLTNNF